MKKWLLIGIVFMIALSGALVGCSCEKTDGEQTTKVIRIGDHNVKVVEDLPESLKLVSIRLETRDILPSFVGIFKNVSSQTINFKAIFILDGKRVGAFPLTLPYRTLEPGEEIEFNAAIVELGYLEEPKLLRVELENFNILGGPTTPTEPTEPTTPSEPTTPEPTTPGPEMMPEEVLMKWFNLMKSGKFSEAEKLSTPYFKEYTDSHGGIEKAWQENPMTEIKTLETQFETETAIVYVVITFEDGTVHDNGAKVHFKKINNEWKINSFSK